MAKDHIIDKNEFKKINYQKGTHLFAVNQLQIVCTSTYPREISKHRETGNQGEALAVNYLMPQGFEILQVSV